MKTIVDSNGNLVSGLKRGANGEIIVDDSLALNRFKAAQMLEKRVGETEKQIAEMHSMLQMILQHVSDGQKK